MFLQHLVLIEKQPGSYGFVAVQGPAPELTAWAGTYLRYFPRAFFSIANEINRQYFLAASACCRQRRLSLLNAQS